MKKCDRGLEKPEAAGRRQHFQAREKINTLFAVVGRSVLGPRAQDLGHSFSQ